MLANFYLNEFDRRMLGHGFNLIRYADDFVVMCETPERAQQAHLLGRDILKTLNLEIHGLDEPNSKSRIGNFSKDGLLFLGIRFEGKEVFPAKKSIERLKSKVNDILKPASGDSLFKTLQKLANLINGWGKCYRAMRVLDIFQKLDDFVKSSVETYLERVGVRLVGKNKRKHMKLLGVPSLTAMAEFKKKKTPDQPSNAAQFSSGNDGSIPTSIAAINDVIGNSDLIPSEQRAFEIERPPN
jgi:RNA-directed DNA polymerase